SYSSDPKVQTLLQTIAREKRNLEGAKAVMRAVEQSSKNEAVIQHAQNEVRAAQESIQYLEGELSKLSMGGSGRGSPAGTPTKGESSSSGRGGQQGMMPTPGRGGPMGPGAMSPSPSRGSLADSRDRPLPPPPTGPGAGPEDVMRRPEQKNYTQLDLLRYDAPLTGAKIAKMLNQLQFKLQIEEQYKLGIDKMAQAYKAEGDKRLRSETEAKRIESEGKIQLLRKAMKRYETLAKFGSAVEDSEDLLPDQKRKEALRKPISGQLNISLRSARDLNHRPLPRKSSKVFNETTVVIKIEGTERAVSLPSRNDRWLEDFHLPVEKANEVEITIYDSIGTGDSIPIGMLWLRVSDLLDGLRRQKVGMEVQGAGWVTADKAASMGPRTGSAPDSVTLHSSGTIRQPGAGGPTQDGKLTEGIDGWWSVEPAGAISLRLDFIKDTADGARRPYDALGRQGAVRKRKGDVFEMNGHKFIQRQFYQPIMCALCQEFLLTGDGYQCADCRYACHRKCYPKVVTKCISKSNADADADEDKINHRIPHRFAAYTNISANWCCHCGYMMSFGRKNSVKCSECGLTCHQTCSHLIPDFCGMTMEMANILLKNLRDIKTTQVSKKTTPASSTTALSTISAPERPPPLQHQLSAGSVPSFKSAPPTSQYAPPDQRQGAPQLPVMPAQSAYDNLRPAPSGGRPMPHVPSGPPHRPSYEQQRPQEAYPQRR
ncbi:protein kinase C, partial [Saitozyma sp. JCM 24511]